MNELSYQRVERYIAQQLADGIWRPGDRLPPERQIAEMFETSTKSVKRAMETFVRKGVLERARGRGTFVIDHKQGRKNCIGVIYCIGRTSLLANSFYRTIFSGIEMECLNSSRNVLLLSISRKSPSEIEREIERAGDEVDALLVMDVWPSQYRAVEAGLKHAGVPSVVLNYEDPAVPFDSVVFDSRLNAKRITEYLTARGHKRISFVKIESEFYSELHPNHGSRVKGYEEAMNDAGLKPQLIDLVSLREASSLKDLLAGSKAPTAFVCANDRTALMIMDLAREAGISVPDDLAVVGYDGIPEGRSCEPVLTTINTPLQEMGGVAVRRLEERLGGQRGLPYRAVIPCELFEGGSC